jgi:hypothetical protein
MKRDFSHKKIERKMTGMMNRIKKFSVRNNKKEFKLWIYSEGFPSFMNQPHHP